jgi:hypothetical protein
MRGFVETFRTHLKDAGAAHDDEVVWQLLRGLHILVFDFTATGSASEELAKERAARALHPEDSSRAGNLWYELVELSIEIAKAGGDRGRAELKTELGQACCRTEGVSDRAGEKGTGGRPAFLLGGIFRVSTKPGRCVPTNRAASLGL